MDHAFRFAAKFAADHPAEAVDRLVSLSPGNVASFLGRVDATTAARLLDRMAPPIAGSVLEAMEVGVAVDVLLLVSVDRCVRALRNVSPERRAQILLLMPDELAKLVERILGYPDGSAGSIADGSVTALPSDMTIDTARRVARDPRVPYVYVVDREHTLVGVVHKRDLDAGSKGATLREIIAPVVARVPANASVAQLQRHRAWRDFDVLPVVDGRGIYLGAIRHKDLRIPDEPHVAVGGTGPPLATFLDLSELYWEGLASMVAALSAGMTAAHREEAHDAM
jgi:magnesium transporter